MLTILQKQALLALIDKETQDEPNVIRYWRDTRREIAEDLKRHLLARQRSHDRNAAKKTRRDQRGPIV